jgi:hypothetical protein
MLRVSPYAFGGRGNEVNMGNAAVIEKLAGSVELDELYRLDASESDPEDEPDEDDDEGEGEGEDHDDEDEGGGGIKPEGMPHD